MCAVAFSRVLGLFRDRLLAARFTPDALGVYYAAFRLPNMIFELLVMGALATAFIPVFTQYRDTKGDDEAFHLASIVINIGIIVFVFISIPIAIFATPISRMLAPGFKDDQIALMAQFTQIMILAQVFPLIIGNFLTGILQSFRNFLIPALAPVAYNLGIIVGILLFSNALGLYAPVIGVVIGAVLFVLIQIPAVLAYGYRHRMSIQTSHPGAREVGKLMIPRTVGLGVSQIDSTIDLILSSLMGAGAVTVFNFAQHLQQLPVGLFGASIAQATLPALSSAFAMKKDAEYKSIFLSSFNQILFLVVPLSVLLIVLRIPMVRLVFGSSILFDWESTVLTGKTLAFFSISLFAQSLVHLLARSFFAIHDTRTPVIISVISVIVNILFSIWFVIFAKMPIWSLGLSTSIANIANMVLLLIFLDRKVHTLDRITLIVPAIKIMIAGFLSGVALYIPIKLLDQLVFDTTRTINLILLTGVATTAGLTVYLLIAWVLGVDQVSIITRIFGRALTLRKGVVMDTTQEMVETGRSEV